jgi:hypothetical protein
MSVGSVVAQRQRGRMPKGAIAAELTNTNDKRRLHPLGSALPQAGDGRSITFNGVYRYAIWRHG